MLRFTIDKKKGNIRTNTKLLLDAARIHECNKWCLTHIEKEHD